ncbi:MAG: hypothetical protein DRJ96_08585 [Thermoprotei archaeon]|nr:MAG: hypothetical protein DRJ67_05595 [Thermoprotei archaeon]RLE95465.1 MAG: hypothetical protein DRJ96_08585 [Thermoprotei archaeon]
MARWHTLILLALLALACRAQPQYWVALNFDLHFRRDGVVVVRALFHPFTLEGESLYGNSTVEEELRHGQNVTINEIALMFTNDPGSLKYVLLEPLHPEDTAVVYCDVYGYGRFEELKGAYVISVAVYLNTSEFVKIEDSVVTVEVRDSYTSRDPRSWIDVLRASFDEGVLLSYSWRPSQAGGPSLKEGGVLIWMNLNEPEAPDFYVFRLKLPDFKLVRLPSELQVKILEAEVVDSIVTVTLAAEKGQGYSFVKLIDEGGEQVRKVYLRAGETARVSFKPTGEPLRVEVWSGHCKIAESPLKHVSTPISLLSPRRAAGIALLAIAATLIIIAIKRREHGMPSETAGLEREKPSPRELELI